LIIGALLRSRSLLFDFAYNVHHDHTRDGGLTDAEQKSHWSMKSNEIEEYGKQRTGLTQLGHDNFATRNNRRYTMGARCGCLIPQRALRRR
jgi:hypothetical protein